MGFARRPHTHASINLLSPSVNIPSLCMYVKQLRQTSMQNQHMNESAGYAANVTVTSVVTVCHKAPPPLSPRHVAPATVVTKRITIIEQATNAIKCSSATRSVRRLTAPFVTTTGNPLSGLSCSCIQLTYCSTAQSQFQQNTGHPLRQTALTFGGSQPSSDGASKFRHGSLRNYHLHALS